MPLPQGADLDTNLLQSEGIIDTSGEIADIARFAALVDPNAIIQFPLDVSLDMQISDFSVADAELYQSPLKS